MAKRDLTGRVAVVTGAASGIGRATALCLADEGCHLALVDIDEAGLEETRRDVRSRDVRCTTHRADVSNEGRMRELPAEIAAEHGQLHILVNNAGISVGAMFRDCSIEELERLFGINIWGVVYGCKFFLPYLNKADWAQIVNISSVFGLFGLPGQAGYSMTKAAVKGLSEALWTELANTNVSVTSVHPGFIRTNLIRNSRIEDPEERAKAIEMADKFGTPAQKAGRAIVKGIARNKPRVVIGPDAHISALLKRAFPVGFHRVMTAGFKRSNLKGMQD